MNENRVVSREPIIGVSLLAQRSEGFLLEGVVLDVSDGGLIISGDASSLKVGERLELTLVVQGEKIHYTSEVRYLDPVRRWYGVRFCSGPERVVEPSSARRCMRCRKDFPADCNYCSQCGQKLVTR